MNISNRFSFVIPAHNEEGYLGETLKSLMQLDYPESLYEVLVVENGSNDGTSDICKRFAKKYAKITFLTSLRGVSRARNTGFSESDPSSDWIVFLDADTLLEKQFLFELNRYLGKEYPANLVVGTTSILPAGAVSLYARSWYKLYDICHQLTRTSYSLQIVCRQVAEKIQYDEELHYAEDLQYIKDAEKYGKFFFFKTTTVSSSTRRFEKRGYLTQALLWTFQALQPKGMKKKRGYEVVR